MKKLTVLTSLSIIIALFAVSFAPAMLANEESSAVSAPAGGESGEDEEPSQPQNPEKCYLTFVEPARGTLDVAKGYVGFELDVGTSTSTYAFNYGDTAVVTLTPGENAVFGFAELNGIDVAPVGNILSIEMIKDYVLNVNFQQHEYLDVNIVCNFVSGSDKGVIIKLDGVPVAGGLRVTRGRTLNFSFSASDGGKIALVTAKYVTEDGNTLDVPFDNTAMTFSTLPITKSGTLNLSFGSPLVVTINQTAGGTVSSSEVHPMKGQSVTFTFTPDDGYYLRCFVIDGGEIPADTNEYTYTVEDDITVSAVFALISQDVTVTLEAAAGQGETPHGVISFVGELGDTLTVSQGSLVSMLVTPDEGYEITSVKINGTPFEVDENGALSVNAAEDLHVVATFGIIQYRITAVVTAQGGGKITAVDYEIARNVVYVNYGESITFVFTPDMHYKIYSVKCDSVTVYSDKEGGTLENNSYTFTDVKANHTIAVTFVPEGSVVTEYTITSSAGANGSISPPGTQTVVQGETVSYTVTPDNGYQVDYVKVDGIDVPLSDSTYTFISVSANHNIEAFFKPKSTSGDDGVINVEDVDWTTSVILIDLTETTLLDKAVLDKLSADCQGRSVMFKASDYEVTFTVNSTIATSYLQLNLTLKRNLENPDYESIRSIITSSEQYANSIFTIVKLEDIFPAQATAKVFVGEIFAGKPLSYYVYDAGELVRAAENAACDEDGYATVTLKNSKELVFIAEGLPADFTVTVVSGENGSVSPAGAVIVKKGETFVFTPTPNEGYRVSRILVNGSSVQINGDQYSVVIESDTEIEVRFSLLKDPSSPKAGLFISIAILSVGLVAGGVLLVIKWRQTRY